MITSSCKVLDLPFKKRKRKRQNSEGAREYVNINLFI